MAQDNMDRMYLVCQHKTNSRQLVPNGLSILDEEAIVMIVSRNPDIRMITKAIQPGCTSVDIYKIDLVPDAEKTAFEKKLKAKGKEEVPWKEFFGHEWEGHSFEELMILVPESAIPKLDDGKAKQGDGESQQ
jgi:hypothetical protein